MTHLAAIVEFSEDSIISKTLEGKILTWNRGAENVHGCTAAEAIGRPMPLLLPEDRQPDYEAFVADLKAVSRRLKATSGGASGGQT